MFKGLDLEQFETPYVKAYSCELQKLCKERRAVPIPSSNGVNQSVRLKTVLRLEKQVDIDDH